MVTVHALAEEQLAADLALGRVRRFSVVVAAILDRLLDGAAIINIKGPSWRLPEHQALTQPLAQLVDSPTDRPTRHR